MLINFLKEIAAGWDTDKPARLAAGLAYYSMFSLAPIIFIALTVAGFFIDSVLLAEELFLRIGNLLGAETATMIESLIDTAAESTEGATFIGSLIGILALLFAASGLFANLKYSMNTVWQVPPSEYSGILSFIKTRLIAFVIVIGLGIMLVVGTVLSLLINWIGALFPTLENLNLFGMIPVILLVFISLLIFYKILPDTHVGWRDVWLPALVITIMYLIGVWLVRVVIGGLNLTSALEAAGAIVILLMAIYYAAQIFLLGAEISKVFAYRFGSRKGMEISE
ncbi:MAG: YihY/virulence factor BrkB family protein [Chloroflexota bacterium]|nr:YihY/virulence factor BrkB family protein [Chloroflexota bacterium]